MPTRANPDLAVDPRLDREQILRRYLDLPKYIALLRTRSIYLQRVDLFPDKLEGVLTPGIRRGLDDAYASNESPYNADMFAAQVRGGVYLSCWSSGAHDNMALWQLYGSPTMGVVVTTTVGQLIDAALMWANDETIEIFKVKYIDHLKNPDITIGRYSDPLRYKHRAYAFEDEVRIVLSRVGTEKPKPYGLQFSVELDQLIRSVVIAPEAPDWFADLIRDVTNRYALASPVRRSTLAFVKAGTSSQEPQ